MNAIYDSRDSSVRQKHAASATCNALDFRQREHGLERWACILRRMYPLASHSVHTGTVPARRAIRIVHEKLGRRVVLQSSSSIFGSFTSHYNEVLLRRRCFLVLRRPGRALPAELKDAEASNAAHGCPNGNRATPLYRAFNPSVTDHFYTTNAVEVRNARGYQQEGQAGRVFSRQESSTIPFYRLYNPSNANHFYTTNQWEADNAANTLGYNREGVAGYVLAHTSVVPFHCTVCTKLALSTTFIPPTSGRPTTLPTPLVTPVKVLLDISSSDHIWHLLSD
ncbi:Glycoside hydrolase, family [Salix suchowensis]|nr:Glycoside hydrolase, family [Salix suchowensis]